MHIQKMGKACSFKFPKSAMQDLATTIKSGDKGLE
jgi:hypothetical protein